MRRAAS